MKKGTLKRTIKVHYEQIYVRTFENLNEIDKFLGK